MRRIWFQGGSFIAAAGAWLMLGAVNCLSLRAGELRVLPPTFPTTNRIRLQLEGLAAGQRAEVQAIPKLGSPPGEFSSVAIGSRGESVFEIPVPWSEEGYFRAVALEVDPASMQLSLQVPTALQPAVSAQPILLAPQGRLVAAETDALENGWLDVRMSPSTSGAGEIKLLASDRVRVDADGTVRWVGLAIARSEASSEGLRLRFGRGATAEALTEVLRQITYTGRSAGREARLRTIQWELRDGRGRRGVPRVQAVELAEDCDAPLDVVLVLDRTSSISLADFELLHTAANRFVEQLGLAEGRRRAAVVSFCSSGYTHLGLSADLRTLQASINGVHRSAHLGGVLCDGTAVGTGIREGLQVLSSSSHRRVMLLLTDGWESSTTATRDVVRHATIEASAQARAMGVRLIVYALGTNPDTAHLQHLVAGNEDLIPATDYVTLPAMLGRLAGDFCEARNPVPQISAGDDLRVRLSAGAELLGACTNCSTNAQARWEAIAGPGSVSFETRGLRSRAEFSEPGVYTLRLTVSEGLFRASDEAQVVVAGENLPPRVDVQTEQVSGSAMILAARVSDDGLDAEGFRSNQPLSYRWGQASGPGQVRIERPFEAQTFVTLPETGIYVLELEVHDAGGLSSTRQVTLQAQPSAAWEHFPAAGYVTASLGGLRDRGEGRLSLRGVRGPVRRAYLHWHGPVDSERANANAMIRFQGRWIEGESLGISHDDGWTYRQNHLYSTGQSYRANVTALVEGDGNYAVSDLVKTPQINVNGVSLIVLYEESDPHVRRDVSLWSGNESNGGFAPSTDDTVEALGVYPDGRVLIAGMFTEAGGVRRGRVARLLANGQVDLSFDPGPGADGPVHAVAIQSDGVIWLGGAFSQVGGSPRHGLARLTPDGALLDEVQPRTEVGSEVFTLAVQQDEVWAGGRDDLRRFDRSGQTLAVYHPGAVVRVAVVDQEGGVWFGGDQAAESGSRSGWWARQPRGGALEVLSAPVDGPILALAESGDGGWYLGGRFSEWKGVTRHGVAKVGSDGQLDLGWVPDALNALPDQSVSALHVQTPGPDQAWSTSLLVVGGSLWLSSEAGASPVSLCRLVDGNVGNDPFQVLPRRVGEGVEAIEPAGDAGEIWIAGRFWKEAQRNRARLSPAGTVAELNSGDQGWNLALPVRALTALDELELHVSDGQPCFGCLGNGSGLFLDPILLVGNQVWKAPSLQTLCGVEQEQLFAGLSVPSTVDECWKGDGLWDVLRSPLMESEPGGRPVILRSEYQGASSQEDLVTLVAAAVLSPSTAAAVPLPRLQASLPQDDRYHLVRTHGNQRLPVLANDWLPSSARLVSVSQPSSGRVRIAPDATSVVFEPDFGSEMQIEDHFSYVVGWDKGMLSTGYVALTLSGPAPILLPEQGTSTPLELTSGPSFFRGPRHYSQAFQYEAKGTERLDLEVLDPEFSAHIYLRDPNGEVVASAWHDSDSFGAFTPQVTPVHLHWDISLPGRYGIEIAGNAPQEGGAYTLQVGRDWLDGARLGLRVNGVEVENHFQLGWMPSPVSALEIEWRNLTSLSIPGLSFEAYCGHPQLEATADASESIDLGAGESGRWICRIKRSNSAEQGTAEVVFRALVAGQVVQQSVGHVRFGSDSLGLHLQAQVWSPSMVKLEALSLRDEPASPTSFVIESGGHQNVLSSEGSSVIWSNAAPGTYFVWAQTERSVSQRLSLQIAPPAPLGKAVPDVFQVGVGSVSNRLPVLANDSNMLSLLSVSSASLGQVRVLPDGALEYSARAEAIGVDRLTYTALDSAGGEATAEVEVQVVEPPIRWLQPAEGSVHSAADPILLEIQTDSTRAPAVQTRFFANERRIPSSEAADLSVQWISSFTGFVSLRAEVMDEQGVWWRSETRRIAVGAANDQPPQAQLASPGSGELVEVDRLEIRGAAFDPDEPSTYELILRQTDGEVVQVQHGAGPVVDDRLGDLDLTLLRNGTFDLTLRVVGGVQVVEQTVRFVLQSDAKVGQLLFTETDLEMSAAGLPLVLSRTYDSLNPKGGDFGPGWSLSLYDLQVEIDEEREQWFDAESESSQQVRVGGGRDLTLTLPGGLRTTFRYSLKPGPSDGGVPCFCYEAQWDAPPGLPASLTALGNRELRFIPFQQELPPFWIDAGPGTPMENYDFRGWVLTNVDGTVLQILRPSLGTMPVEGEGALARSVEVFGRPVLRSLRLPTGERIEISEAAALRIDHVDASSRKTRSLVLRRGPHGFVSEAFDSSSLSPSGEVQPGAWPVVKYDYEPTSGHLVAVHRLQDRASGRYSTRSYDYTNRFFPHYLTAIRDERGVVAMRPGYDAEGRLAGMTDAGGYATRLHHDPANRREESVDALGNRTVHDYDRYGNVVQTIDATGRITRRSFGPSHLLLAETNAWGTEGESWTMRSYDSAGRLRSRVDRQGTNEFLFDDAARLRFHRDPFGIVTTNHYDDEGHLVESIRIAGSSRQESRHGYDAAGRLVESVDVLGAVTHFAYDQAGQVTHQTIVSPDGKLLDSSAMTYDLNGNRLSESQVRTGWDGQPEAITHRYSYDGQNQLIETLDPLGGVQQTRTDDQGRRVAERDQLGRWTWHHYNRRGQLVQTVYPADPQTPRVVTRTVYDPMARPIYVQQAAFLPEQESVTNSLIVCSGNYTVYDAVGRVVKAGQCRNLAIRLTLDPDGIPQSELVGDPEVLSVRETAYDQAGRISWTRDPNGSLTAYGYDSAGRRTVVTNAWTTARQAVVQSLYSYPGLLTATVDPLGRRTDFASDDWGRRVATWFPEVEGRRSVSLVAYDEAGNQALTTNEVGIVTGFGYDVLGRLIAVTNALGSSNQIVTRYAYDEAGNQISQTDALGRTTRYAYDVLGRRVLRELPAGEREWLGYDPVGNLIVRTNFNGRVIEQTFDARDRLLRKRERLEVGEELLAEFTYTATGRRATQLDPSGSTTYAYDDWDRLQVRDKPGWGRLDYEYLPGGQVSRTTVDTGNRWWQVLYDYDELGRLTGARIPQFEVGASYEYTTAGMLKETRFANGVTNSYRYDERDRLRNLSWGKEGELLARFDYRVNEAGQRYRLDEAFPKFGTPPRTYQWEYDDLQRLTRETISGLGAAAYQYDRVGNRLRRDSTLPGISSTRADYDLNDRIDPDQIPTNANPDYDAAGNTLRGEYQGRRYEDRYDAENRLVERHYLTD